MFLFKSTIVLLFIVVICSFLLPAALNPPEIGDIRGGDTSIKYQLQLLYHNPFGYLFILFSNIYNDFISYFFGPNPLLNFAYAGNISYISNIYFIQLMMMLFSTINMNNFNNDDIFILRDKYKYYIAIVILSIIVLIWTSMYLAFSPIGSIDIKGVQKRYYLPLLLPFLLLFDNTVISIKISKLNYNRFIISGCSLTLVYSIYKILLFN